MSEKVKFFCGFNEDSPEEGFGLHIVQGDQCEDILGEIWLSEKDAAFLVSKLGQYFMSLKDIEEEK